MIETKKPFKKVGTHHGRFHADEVMATAILKEIFDIEVVRTRDTERFKDLEIVYDVGGGEFDHHGVDKLYRDNGTPYAACGLIWNRFGKDVVTSKGLSLTEEDIDSVHKYVDRALIEGIDAIDNGLKTGEVVIPTMNISSIISGFNPTWDSEVSEDIAFNGAVQFASAVLENTLEQKFASVKAREIVVDAYEKRPRKEVMVLDAFYPWMRALKEIDKEKEVLFIIYPSKEGYLIHTIREQGGSLKARKDLPKDWAGKRDQELGGIIGIDDAIFCHTGRFIGGAGSFDSIMKMADAAVNEPSEGMLQRIIFTIKKLVRR